MDKKFTVEYYKMDNKHIEIYSTSRAIREIHCKTIRYLYFKTMEE